jgi:single-strand DNA-binding protein
VSRSLNKVTLIGNLGSEPEVRSTANGTRVATLSVATSRNWNNQAGERQEKTEWHRVVLWNNKNSGLADVAEKYLKKGDKVYVEGRIEYRTWEDREGKTRYTTEINAREMIMLSPRGEAGESEHSVPAPAPQAAVAEKGNKGSYDDFPEALDEEDDDLPF